MIKPETEGLTEAQHVFNDCKTENEFVLASGKHLKNVYELTDAMQTISHEEFYLHANFQKNDFANWVEHVFHLKKEADALRAIESPENTAAYLSKLINDSKIIIEKEKRLRARIEELKSRVPKPPSVEIINKEAEIIVSLPQKHEQVQKVEQIQIQVPVMIEEKKPEQIPTINDQDKKRQEVEKTLKELTKNIKKPIKEKEEIKKPQDPKMNMHKDSNYVLGFKNPVLWIGVLSGLIIGIIVTALAYSLLD